MVRRCVRIRALFAASSREGNFSAAFHRSRTPPIFIQVTQAMEFVELLLLCVAVLLLIFKPERERLAWWLTIGGWAVVVFMYVGHVSTAILGQLNL